MDAVHDWTTQRDPITSRYHEARVRVLDVATLVERELIALAARYLAGDDADCALIGEAVLIGAATAGCWPPTCCECVQSEG